MKSPNKKTWILVAVLLAFLIQLVAAQPVQAAYAGYLSPDYGEVASGETVAIDVWIDVEEEISFYQFEIAYDNSRFVYSDVYFYLSGQNDVADSGSTVTIASYSSSGTAQTIATLYFTAVGGAGSSAGFVMTKGIANTTLSSLGETSVGISDDYYSPVPEQLSGDPLDPGPIADPVDEEPEQIVGYEEVDAAILDPTPLESDPDDGIILMTEGSGAEIPTMTNPSGAATALRNAFGKPLTLVTALPDGVEPPEGFVEIEATLNNRKIPAWIPDDHERD